MIILVQLLFIQNFIFEIQLTKILVHQNFSQHLILHFLNFNLKNFLTFLNNFFQ